MINYKINKKDYKFLIENLKEGKNINSLKKSIDYKSIENDENFLILKLYKQDVDSILEELGKLFTSEGLSKDYEPNKLGLYIENLIDFFNRKLF